MSQPDDYVKCRCQNCDKGIEFAAADLSDANSIINCPHCGVETRLYVPPADGALPFTVTPQSNEIPPLPPPLMTQAAPSPKALKLRWHGNELELAHDQVIIRKYDLVRAFKYDKTADRAISIASITAIQVRHADLMNAGRIIFLYPGSTSFAENGEDSDIFLFGIELNKQVDDFKNTVESMMRSMRQPVHASNVTHLPDEIRKLAELKQQGLLSENEFEAAKKKLLA